MYATYKCEEQGKFLENSESQHIYIMQAHKNSLPHPEREETHAPTHMKNTYKRGKVHPSPSPPPSVTDHYLSLLPATILTLTAALSLEDKQVLAYLVSYCGTVTSSSTGKHLRATHKSFIGHDDRGSGGGGGGEHGPSFGCDCFRCYMSYWVRWDTSPNRQVIHEIIEAYEEELLLSQKKKNKNMLKRKKERGKKVFDNFDYKDNIVVGSCNDRTLEEDKNKEEGLMVEKGELGELELMEPGQSENVAAELEKGTVRKIVSFIGEKIWGVWNRD